MTTNKYPLYGVGLVLAAAIAVWAGLPPTLLLIFLVCPLMMFFMMRGMHGGNANRDEHADHHHSYPTDPRHTAPTGQQHLDGAHERIDLPYGIAHTAGVR